MPCQLLDDCLNEIFEYLEEDKITLSSCLLVNRLWCEISVRILWRNVWNFKPRRPHMPPGIINTLISCLPNESKDLIYKKENIKTPTRKLPLFNCTSFCKVIPICGIKQYKEESTIQALIWKPPLFNYASFCKVISIIGIKLMVDHILGFDTLQINKSLLSQEILRMFFNQISSLKSLEYYCLDCVDYVFVYHYFMLPYYPEARNLLTDLRELNCFSDIKSEFFNQISQTCNNIRSLTIHFGFYVSDGLANLISLQNNLKSLTLSNYDSCNGIEIIIPSLTKISSTITKLTIKNSYMPLSFISKFKNLQELIFLFNYYSNWRGNEYFYQLQDVKFPKLKILKFLYDCPNHKNLIQFLKINGKNLNEIYLWDSDNSLNLAIAKFCPNLKTLFTIFLNDEAETLKEILISCQYLESINFWCYDECLDEKEFLDIIVKYSSKNFHKLEMYYVYDNAKSKILSKDLDQFFINWKNQKPLSLIIIRDFDNISLVNNKENKIIIENYMKMGFFKKFVIKEYEREELSEYFSIE